MSHFSVETIICFLRSACVGEVTLFLKDVCSLPTLETRARNLRNLFSKLLILQNNQPPPYKPCQIPCWTMLVLFTWKRKLAWAAAFINFPFSHFAHHLFVMAWRRPILGPAGCPMRMASPKISSSQRWPFLQLCHCGCLQIPLPPKKKKQLCITSCLCLVFRFFLVGGEDI